MLISYDAIGRRRVRLLLPGSRRRVPGPKGTPRISDAVTHCFCFFARGNYKCVRCCQREWFCASIHANYVKHSPVGKLWIVTISFNFPRASTSCGLTLATRTIKSQYYRPVILGWKSGAQVPDLIDMSTCAYRIPDLMGTSIIFYLWVSPVTNSNRIGYPDLNI
jgi:hypothetical protein